MLLALLREPSERRLCQLRDHSRTLRPAGRLGFSIGHDLNEQIRVDVGGSNILRNKYKSYYNQDWAVLDYRDDDTIYTLGVRFRL
jgi:iron complex outermembrane recepter protein